VHRCLPERFRRVPGRGGAVEIAGLDGPKPSGVKRRCSSTLWRLWKASPPPLLRRKRAQRELVQHELARDEFAPPGPQMAAWQFAR
jgi:hypothetical protein